MLFKRISGDWCEPLATEVVLEVFVFPDFCFLLPNFLRESVLSKIGVALGIAVWISGG